MVKGFYFFVTSLVLFQCSSIDFIPEPDYTNSFPGYQKNSWEEVEILFSRPNRRFRIYGEIIVRDFQNTGTLSYYQTELKKELYRRKMDGVYIKNQNSLQIYEPIFQTMDSRGNITHTHESSKSMKVWKGYAFRYQD